MKSFWSLLVLCLIPGLLPELRADVRAERLAEIPSAMDAAVVAGHAIAEMTRPHKAGGKTLSYGLGWQCSPPDKPAIPGFSPRSFGHGGAFATHGWIDPEQRVVTVFLVQNVLVTGSGSIRNAFHEKVTGAGAAKAQ